MRKLHRAFSLIELLIVIGIIAFLASLAAPAVTTMMRGTQLSRAGDQMVAVLSLARQTALAKNRTVEVRFYQYADTETPGETSAANGMYRALQAFVYDESGTVATPIGKCEVLPQTIIIDSGAISTLIASMPVATGSSAAMSIPRVGTSYNYRAFRFLSDGSAHSKSSAGNTGLAKTDKWFLTMHNKLDGDGKGDVTGIKNFATIQIDPANGSFKTWRP